MYCITGIASLKHATADVFVYTISALLPEFLCFCWCCKISWHSSSKNVQNAVNVWLAAAWAAALTGCVPFSYASPHRLIKSITNRPFSAQLAEHAKFKTTRSICTCVSSQCDSIDDVASNNCAGSHNESSSGSVPAWNRSSRTIFYIQYGQLLHNIFNGNRIKTTYIKARQCQWNQFTSFTLKRQLKGYKTCRSQLMGRAS